MIMAAGSLAGEQAAPDAVATQVSLQELVAAADLVALVQVLDTDYEYSREFPSGGTAFLRVLIPYKVTRPLEDIIEVYDEGLHEGECYFDNPTVLEEGRRHLVFLRISEEVEKQYNGLQAGCKLEVLVNRDNRYALRYPVNGLRLSDDFSAYASAMEFGDAYALLEDEEITPGERNELLDSGFLTQLDGRFRYSHGIDITVMRQLMGPEGLTLDRSLK